MSRDCTEAHQHNAARLGHGGGIEIVERQANSRLGAHR